MKRFIYIRVPSCPRCASLKTGFYIKGNYERLKTMLKLAKKGMLAKTIYEPEVAINGLCFCNNCGYQWMGRKEFKFIKKEELNQEKRSRETEQYAELIKKQLKEKYRTPSSLI